MSALAPQVFTNISPEQFAAIEQRAASESGLAINGPSGKSSKAGVEIEWNYDGSTLTITCTHDPFYVPAAKIIAGIQELVLGKNS